MVLASHTLRWHPKSVGCRCPLSGHSVWSMECCILTVPRSSPVVRFCFDYNFSHFPSLKPNCASSSVLHRLEDVKHYSSPSEEKAKDGISFKKTVDIQYKATSFHQSQGLPHPHRSRWLRLVTSCRVLSRSPSLSYTNKSLTDAAQLRPRWNAKMQS